MGVNGRSLAGWHDVGTPAGFRTAEVLVVGTHTTLAGAAAARAAVLARWMDRGALGGG